jgi:hypothetical protein
LINSLFLTVQKYGNKVKNSGKEGIFKSVKQQFEDPQNGRCNQNGKRGIESPVRPTGTYGTENPAAGKRIGKGESALLLRAKPEKLNAYNPSGRTDTAEEENATDCLPVCFVFSNLQLQEA